MSRRLTHAALLTAALLLSGSRAAAQDGTAVTIRRAAGLPAETATGQIEIVDIGHGPLDTMLSIVANHTPAGWKVSYACAMSPHCAEGKESAAREYMLSATDGAKVEQILADLRQGDEPQGFVAAPNVIGGRLAVWIDYEGFKAEYQRAGTWSRTLGELDHLLSPPS